MAGKHKLASTLAGEMKPVLPALRSLTQWLVAESADGPSPDSLLAWQIEQQSAPLTADTLGLSAVPEAIGLLTWAACGHLDGMRRLLGSKDETPHPHALVSLARGAIENSALAFWLVDPRIEVEERRRRFSIYQWVGLTERAKLGSGAEHISSTANDLKAAAEKLGWSLRPPSKTDLVAQLFSDSSMDPGVAVGAYSYRLHSAVAHGSFHALTEFTHPVDSSGYLVGATGKQAFTLCVTPAASAIQLLGYSLVEALGRSPDAWCAIIKECVSADARHLMPDGKDVIPPA